MPNFTFKISDCAIPEKPFHNPSTNYLSGYLHYTEGSVFFKKGFKTFSKSCIDVILAKCSPESRFEVTGSITKDSGAKGTKGEGREFEKLVVDSVKLTNGIEKKEWTNPLDAQEDDDIPF